MLERSFTGLKRVLLVPSHGQSAARTQIPPLLTSVIFWSGSSRDHQLCLDCNSFSKLPPNVTPLSGEALGTGDLETHTVRVTFIVAEVNFFLSSKVQSICMLVLSTHLGHGARMYLTGNAFGGAKVSFISRVCHSLHQAAHTDSVSFMLHWTCGTQVCQHHLGASLQCVVLQTRVEHLNVVFFQIPLA